MVVTRYFLDTEFIEDGRTIDLLSIGIVSDNGRELQCFSTECDLRKASPWVRSNVLPHLPPYADPRWMPRAAIASAVKLFVSGGRGMPEFWAYFADYDWVAFCQLFGTMMDLPNSFPMFCMDLKQLSVTCGSPELPPQPEKEHDALADARWCRDAFRMLTPPAPSREGEVK